MVLLLPGTNFVAAVEPAVVAPDMLNAGASARHSSLRNHRRSTRNVSVQTTPFYNDAFSDADDGDSTFGADDGLPANEEELLALTEQAHARRVRLEQKLAAFDAEVWQQRAMIGAALNRADAAAGSVNQLKGDCKMLGADIQKLVDQDSAQARLMSEITRVLRKAARELEEYADGSSAARQGAHTARRRASATAAAHSGVRTRLRVLELDAVAARRAGEAASTELECREKAIADFVSKRDAAVAHVQAFNENDLECALLKAAIDDAPPGPCSHAAVDRWNAARARQAELERGCEAALAVSASFTEQKVAELRQARDEADRRHRGLAATHRAALAAVQRQWRVLGVTEHWVRSRAELVRTADVAMFGAKLQKQLAKAIKAGIQARFNAEVEVSKSNREKRRALRRDLWTTEAKLRRAQQAAKVATNAVTDRERELSATERAAEKLRARLHPPSAPPSVPGGTAGQ